MKLTRANARRISELATFSRMRRIGRLMVCASALVEACGRSVTPPAAAPAPAPRPPGSAARPPAATATSVPALPPIPPVDGPLQIHVQYPAPNQLIGARDSN